MFGGLTMKPQEAGAFLTIHLKALADNYRALQTRLGETECGAVLKADAYGLGAAQIGKTLYDAGCRRFFVAYGFEGAKLRETVPADADIFVLHGVFAQTEQDFRDASLTPVLNTPEQLKRWSDFAARRGEKLPCALHVDTGMTRLAFTEEQVFAMTAADFAHLDVKVVISHLACGERGDAMNETQLRQFDKLSARLKTVLPPFKESLSASSGIFLDAPYHKDIARAGIVLYGFMENLTPAVELKARILEIQDVPAGKTIGYGATAVMKNGGRVATVSLGYGDGYPRLMSNAGHAFINGKKVNVIGRISMDLTILDVSDLSEDELAGAEFAEFIGKYGSLAELAQVAKTIDYEFLTNLGNRLYRVYTD